MEEQTQELKKKPGPKPKFKEIQAPPTLTILEQIEFMKASGIPLSYCVFHRAILSAMNEPETALFSETPKSKRKAKMWYTPNGLLIEQRNHLGKMKHKIIPLANVSDTDIET